jgi:very-short-patch-repair endonuclease
MKWKCKHCNLDFDNFSTSQKAAHSHWCDLNPRKLEYAEHLKLARSKVLEHGIWNKGKTKYDNTSIKQATETRRNNLNTGKVIIIGKPHTIESKKILSDKRKLWLHENPDKHPWKKLSKFVSEPCEVLKSKLIEANLNFVEEYTPLSNRYFAIDIALIEKKIGLEVNGNQHYNKDGSLRQYYKNRAELIEQAGWTLIQIHYTKVYDSIYVNDLITNLCNHKA